MENIDSEKDYTVESEAWRKLPLKKMLVCDILPLVYYLNKV